MQDCSIKKRKATLPKNIKPSACGPGFNTWNKEGLSDLWDRFELFQHEGTKQK